MDTCQSVIKSLENTSSRLQKEKIVEQQANQNNQELFEGFNLAFNPYVTFGLKKIPKHNGPDGKGLAWGDFKTLCDTLSSRAITGNAARDMVDDFMHQATQEEWNDWYRRILIKDLKCGVSEVTVNKVVKSINKDFIVPGFACMLAHDGANHEKKITGIKLLEPKLDGVRCLTIVNYENRTVTQFTRNGKVLENFTHITEAILNNIDLLGRSYVLDGEVVSKSFQDLMKQVHRKSDVQAQDAKLMLFDILPLEEFKKGQSVMGQRRRSNLLRSFKPVFDEMGCVDIITQVEVNLDEYVGELEYKQFNKDTVAAGFEGIMIKDPNAKYECKRSTSWLKQKPFIEVSLEIKNVEEGTGRNQGRLGALVLEGVDDGKDIRVNCGSGFSDADRDELWGDRNNLIGQIVEVRADVVTQNQDGTYSLRFPRFVRFRGFVAGEKI